MMYHAVRIPVCAEIQSIYLDGGTLAGKNFSPLRIICAGKLDTWRRGTL